MFKSNFCAQVQLNKVCGNFKIHRR